MITTLRASQQSINVCTDAERFKALGNPARFALLVLIGTHCGTLSVDELQERLREMVPHEIQQPTVSHHLSILARAGFIEGRYEGLERYYRLRGEGFACCQDALVALSRLGSETTP